ncbi:MAG: restriction endonuclease subunit S [Paenibacillus macerans]|uniref:restriction endonuclease subunit S n=1 Tax=Paenibacillus macerans TaxID=44252 RepID=UPI000EE0B87B|nr:restriction endonuclease subunit S [Paenibacillus macerans]MDU7473822.1 restriction endonuclease subunit S [Paenibacillus macerans]GBK62897.1 restriction endonuclease subunit S [Paenibacillus macerans]GBK69209.1 restriction endonuclease subunit S [Paenibacillus macerans]
MRKQRIGELFSISKGKKYDENELNDTNEMVRYIQIDDLRNDENIKMVRKAASGVYVTPNDILIAWDGANAGTVGYNLSGIIGSTIAALRPKDNKDCISYIAMFLQSKSSYLRENCTGATIPHIQKNVLENIEILLPPFEQQKLIADALEKARSLIDKRKQAKAKLDELVQAVFMEMFGDPIENPYNWPIKSFSYFAKIDTMMTTDFETYGEFPHIGIENIEKDTGELANYRLVKDQQLSSGKYVFNEKHIIYSKIRPYLNKVAIPEFPGLCSADSYPILVDNNKSNRIFFAYMLRSKRFLNHVEGLSTRTNIPKVNKPQLESFECPCPPLDLQNDFSRKVTLILESKKLMQLQLQQLESNFQALLQKAFKGELTVKDGVMV